tara:strand:+ start:5046 stop:6092 length:1047 start_codon:yes stop_codon:yes gene_type:complete
MKKRTKVLLFANVPVAEKRSLGGATVLAQEIVNFVKKNDQLVIKQVQIRKFWKPKFQLIDYILWIIKFPFEIIKHDIISIHATKDMHFYFMPILIIWIKLFKKKYVYHCFAGNFHKQYISKRRLHRKIIDLTILKANYLFFETKEMVSFFSKKVKGECIWMPNSRKPQVIERKVFQKKFVFISRILPCKGVEEILAASKKLPEGYTIDFYGPINNSFYDEDYFYKTPINYRGILKPNEVINTLKNYNIMLLPTYCYGEGYPGSIIESLSVGIPVITTNFNCIPEIIEDQKNGILVPIKDSIELLKAILSFTEDNYQLYVDKAIKSFDSLNSEKVFNKFINCYLDGEKT